MATTTAFVRREVMRRRGGSVQVAVVVVVVVARGVWGGRDGEMHTGLQVPRMQVAHTGGLRVCAP